MKLFEVKLLDLSRCDVPNMSVQTYTVSMYTSVTTKFTVFVISKIPIFR